MAVGICLKWFFIESFTVPTESMSPTIQKGSIIWILKTPFQHFTSNDIIAFERNREHFIKRIINTPKDSVFKTTNGWSLKSNFSTPFIIPQKGQTIELNESNFNFYQPLIEKYEKVPAGKLLNKILINSTESNTYTFKQNYYFVQGDNTEGSIDSRQWGLIAESQIMGKAFLINK